MNPHSPSSLVDRNLRRAVELAALHTIIEGTSDEIHRFATFLHAKLDEAIDATIQEMEARLRIEESIKNPKVAEK